MELLDSIFGEGFHRALFGEPPVFYQGMPYAVMTAPEVPLHLRLAQFDQDRSAFDAKYGHRERAEMEPGFYSFTDENGDTTYYLNC